MQCKCINPSISEQNSESQPFSGIAILKKIDDKWFRISQVGKEIKMEEIPPPDIKPPAREPLRSESEKIMKEWEEWKKYREAKETVEDLKYIERKILRMFKSGDLEKIKEATSLWEEFFKPGH